MTEQRVSTAEVLDRVARERRRLKAAVRALGDRATTATVTEGWTAKDALAHMIHWAGQIAFGMGAQIEMPAWVIASGTERPTGDEWNRRVVEHYRNAPLERVWADLDRVVDALIERIGERTNDQMNATDAIPWGGDRPLWQQIASETYQHWPQHSADIERAARVTA
ncbi:MAG: ClbS/DfsB family four-helix bundle protein [Candidatus Limnocylindria bacterium]|jgi:hypothetical protein